MKPIKIIPCLDIKDGRVVKGVKFVNLRDARDPVEAAAAYCRQGADELVFLDIFATVENRKTRFEWVKKVCEVVTVPFAVGGGISSIGVSWTVINSLFTHNRAIGNGGNPAEGGTPGGGSGGAIYNDGTTMTLSLCGTKIEYNEVNAYGAAIFFVSNNHDGTLQIEDSVIQNNIGGSWHILPGISMHDDTNQIIENSVIE